MGRDLLSRLIHGARLSLTVGLAATALAVVVAVLIGGTTGFIGGERRAGCIRGCGAEPSVQRARLLAQVHHRCNDNGVAVNVVENPVRKSVDEGAPSAFRDQRPGTRKLKNPLERPVDLKSKLVSEIGTLLVVVRYGFDPFGSRLREELNCHDREGVA